MKRGRSSGAPAILPAIAGENAGAPLGAMLFATEDAGVARVTAGSQHPVVIVTGAVFLQHGIEWQSNAAASSEAAGRNAATTRSTARARFIRLCEG